MFVRSILASAFSLALAVATLPASATPAATPAPVAGSPGPMAYYIMQGTFIISPPYTDPNACMKALAKIQKDPQPGKDMIVCAHRRP